MPFVQALRRIGDEAGDYVGPDYRLGMSLAVDDVLSGKESLWTAPTFDQVRIAWREMRPYRVGSTPTKRLAITDRWGKRLSS